MNPILARIDSRLIHGTIVENWVHFLNATVIVVANDEIINNGLKLTVMEMAVPPSIHLGVYTLRVATQKLVDGDFKNERVILLFSNIKDAYKAIKYGLKINSLNIGDYQSEGGKLKLSDRVILGEQDIEFLRSIALDGVSVNVQCLPSSKLLIIDKILKGRVI